MYEYPPPRCFFYQTNQTIVFCGFHSFIDYILFHFGIDTENRQMDGQKTTK